MRIEVERLYFLAIMTDRPTNRQTNQPNDHSNDPIVSDVVIVKDK